MRITARPLLAMACHCAGCQKMSASAYSLSIAVPSDAFAVMAGEPVIGGLQGDHVHHYFCGWCMSWMFTRSEGLDWFVNVRTAMLDAPGAFPPFIETFTEEKLPWATTPAKHSFATLPSPEEFERLGAEYQAAH